jgi:beta-lactamase superfamily II metal-dependent hydrolase
MTKKLIADDLVSMGWVDDKGNKNNTILAWGDEVELISERNPDYNEIRGLFAYEKLDDESYEKVEVSGFINKDAELKEPGEIKVLQTSFVDVQQGDGIVIETPEHRRILIDGGDNVMFARYLAQRYPRSSKNKPEEFDAIVVTHGDADHFAGLTKIWKSEENPKPSKRIFLRPKRIFHNGIVKGPSNKDGGQVPDEEILGKTEKCKNILYLTELFDDLLEVEPARLNQPFRAWLEAIRAWEDNGQISDRIKIRRLQFGDDDQFCFLQDEKIKIKVLAPFTDPIGGKRALPMLNEPPKSIELEMAEEVEKVSYKNYSSSHTRNGHSIVLQMIYGNVRFLFTGDLNQQSSLRLIDLAKRNRLHLQSEVFKVPHHGSGDFSHTFTREVKPIVSIISSGDESTKKEYIHPRANLVGSLGKYSRVSRPLIFVTEMVAFYEKLGYSKLSYPESPSHWEGMDFYGFRRKEYGIVHVRTDGKRVLVYTNSGRRNMKESYAFEVKADGKIKTVNVVKIGLPRSKR